MQDMEVRIRVRARGWVEFLRARARVERAHSTIFIHVVESAGMWLWCLRVLVLVVVVTEALWLVLWLLLAPVCSVPVALARTSSCIQPGRAVWLCCAVLCWTLLSPTLPFSNHLPFNLQFTRDSSHLTLRA
eukprot:1660193-Rhodomonas_salina.2